MGTFRVNTVKESWNSFTTRASYAYCRKEKSATHLHAAGKLPLFMRKLPNRLKISMARLPM